MKRGCSWVLIKLANILIICYWKHDPHFWISNILCEWLMRLYFFFWFPIRANCFKHDELNKTGETWVFYFSFSLGGSHKIIFVMKKWSKTTACKMGDALSQLTHWFCVCFSHNFQYLSWSIFQSFYLY